MQITHLINPEPNPRPCKRARKKVSLSLSDLPAEVFSMIYSKLRYEDLMQVRLTERVHQVMVDEYLTQYFFHAVSPDHLNLCLKGYLEGPCNAGNLKKFFDFFEGLAISNQLNENFRRLVAVNFNALLDTAVERKDWELIPDLILASRHFKEEDKQTMISIPWALYHYVISDCYNAEILAEIFFKMRFESGKTSVNGLYPLLWANGRTLRTINSKKTQVPQISYLKKLVEQSQAKKGDMTLADIEAALEDRLSELKHSFLEERIARTVYPQSILLSERFFLSEIEKCLIENTPESLKKISKILTDIRESKTMRWHALMTKIAALLAKHKCEDKFLEAVNLTAWSRSTQKRRMFYLGYGPLKDAGKQLLSSSFAKTLEKGNPLSLKKKYKNLRVEAIHTSSSIGVERLNSLPELNGRMEYIESLLSTPDITLSLSHLMKTEAAPVVENEFIIPEEYHSHLSETLDHLKGALTNARTSENTELFDLQLQCIFGKYVPHSKIPFYLDFGSHLEASTKHVVNELSPLQPNGRSFSRAREFVTRHLSQAYFWGGHAAQLKLIRLIKNTEGRTSLITALFFHHANNFRYTPALNEIANELLELDYKKYCIIMEIWSRIKFDTTREMQITLNNIQEMIFHHVKYKLAAYAIYLKALTLFLTNQPSHFNLIAEEAFHYFQEICSWKEATNRRERTLANFFKALHQASVENSDLKTNWLNQFYQQLIHFLDISKNREEMALKLYQMGVIRPIDLEIRVDCDLTEGQSS